MNSLSASSQAQQTIDGMQSKYWRNKVASWILFEIMRYKPSDKAHQLKMPVIVCIAKKDRKTPADLALQIIKNDPLENAKVILSLISIFDYPNVRALRTANQITFRRKRLMGNVKPIV
ncbi:MAG: hypothetical protein ACPK85_05535 [Methanosarcina sp.]